MNKYDLIVIGAGPGGYVAAEQGAKNGLKTLCIEAADVGGVCLNRGCIPTKTLLDTAKVKETVCDAYDFGIEGVISNSITLDWSKIQFRKQNVVKKLQQGIQGLLRGAKADLIKGTAKIINPTTVEVNNELYTCTYMIIATGSVARKFKLPGFDIGYGSGKVITSDQALELPYIPNKFVVIGGGVIGVEFAILYAELGAEVTILQGVDRILEFLDKDISNEVSKLLTNKKIKIITDVNVSKYENNKVYYLKDNIENYIDFDFCLVSIGRIPDTDIVKTINVNLKPNGSIITNKKMETNIKNVYAIGDCTSEVMLAHAAYKNAIVAIENICNRKAEMDILKVPSCIYTHPQVSTIGYSEEQLKDLKIPYYSGKYLFAHVGKALGANKTFGFIKLLVSQSCGEILGCHIIGEQSANYISEIALAMETEATVYTLMNTVHPHPTYCEIIWEVARKIVHSHFKDFDWGY